MFQSPSPWDEQGLAAWFAGGPSPAEATPQTPASEAYLRVVQPATEEGGTDRSEDEGRQHTGATPLDGELDLRCHSSLSNDPLVSRFTQADAELFSTLFGDSAATAFSNPWSGSVVSHLSDDSVTIDSFIMHGGGGARSTSPPPLVPDSFSPPPASPRPVPVTKRAMSLHPCAVCKRSSGAVIGVPFVHQPTDTHFVCAVCSTTPGFVPVDKPRVKRIKHKKESTSSESELVVCRGAPGWPSLYDNSLVTYTTTTRKLCKPCSTAYNRWSSANRRDPTAPKPRPRPSY